MAVLLTGERRTLNCEPCTLNPNLERIPAGGGVVTAPAHLYHVRMRRLFSLIPALAIVIGVAAMTVDSAKGTVVYKGRTGEHRATIGHVYLVKGPDAVDKKVGRVLIFSAVDLADTVKACATLSCTEQLLTEGFTIGFDTAPFLKFWMTLEKGKVQTSGPANVKSFTATTDTPERLAGTLRFDSFGANVDVQFDAALLKTFTK